VVEKKALDDTIKAEVKKLIEEVKANFKATQAPRLETIKPTPKAEPAETRQPAATAAH
jgi:hypothetical protein